MNDERKKPTIDNKPMKCFNCGEERHFARECKKPRLCRGCGKEGHIVRNCKTIKQAQHHRDKKKRGARKSYHQQKASEDADIDEDDDLDFDDDDNDDPHVPRWHMMRRISDDDFDAMNALNDDNAAEDHCDDQATDSDVEIENVIKLLKLKLKRKKRTKKNQRARFKNGMKRYKMERKPRQSMQSIGYNVSARIDDQSVIFKNKESVTYENDWIKSRKEIQTEIESNSLKGNIYTMENKPHSLNLLNKKKKTQRQKKKKHKHYRLNACDEPSYLEENAHGGAQQAIERDFIDENACVSRIMNDAQYNASIDDGDDGDTAQGSNEDDDIRGDEDVSPRM